MVLLAISLALSMSSPWAAAPPPPEPPPRLGRPLASMLDRRFDTLGIEEPSGITFCSRRQSMFIVGDGGDIAEIGLDGATRITRGSERGDLEDIVILPAGDRLYIIEERTPMVLEVDVERLEITRRLRIDDRLNGVPVLDQSNDGAEGIAVVPGEQDGAADRIFISRQGSIDPERTPPALIELTLLEADESGDTIEFPLTISRVISFEGASDFAALHYDAARGRMVIVSDMEDALYLFDLATNQARRAPRLPGLDQEGFAVDGAGAWYIAQDSGGIIKTQPRNDLGIVWDQAVAVDVVIEQKNTTDATADGD